MDIVTTIITIIIQFSYRVINLLLEGLQLLTEQMWEIPVIEEYQQVVQMVLEVELEQVLIPERVELLLVVVEVLEVLCEVECQVILEHLLPGLEVLRKEQ